MKSNPDSVRNPEDIGVLLFKRLRELQPELDEVFLSSFYSSYYKIIILPSQHTWRLAHKRSLCCINPCCHAQQMDFHSLTVNERATLVWDKGILLTVASHYQHRINLYSLRGKFIEVWYNVLTDKIDDVCSMSKPKLFKKYFSQN